MLTFTRLTVERRSGDLLVLTLTAQDGDQTCTSIYPLPVSETGASVIPATRSQPMRRVYHWTGGLEAPSLFPDIVEVGLRASLRDGVLTPLGKRPRMLRQPVRVTS